MLTAAMRQGWLAAAWQQQQQQVLVDQALQQVEEQLEVARAPLQELHLLPPSPPQAPLEGQQEGEEEEGEVEFPLVEAAVQPWVPLLQP